MVFQGLENYSEWSIRKYARGAPRVFQSMECRLCKTTATGWGDGSFHYARGLDLLRVCPSCFGEALGRAPRKVVISTATPRRASQEPGVVGSTLRFWIDMYSTQEHSPPSVGHGSPGRAAAPPAKYPSVKGKAARRLRLLPSDLEKVSKAVHLTSQRAAGLQRTGDEEVRPPSPRCDMEAVHQSVRRVGEHLQRLGLISPQ